MRLKMDGGRKVYIIYILFFLHIHFTGKRGTGKKDGQSFSPARLNQDYT